MQILIARVILFNFLRQKQHKNRKEKAKQHKVLKVHIELKAFQRYNSLVGIMSTSPLENIFSCVHVKN